MPDPTHRTVSASQAAALLNVHPYLTRWMLYQKFVAPTADEDDDNRLRWGRLMQPLILAEAARDLRMQVRPNEADTYVRRGVLGCTRDADIIAPDLGPGALEVGVAFDYRSFAERWGGGAAPPMDKEIQVQVQMYVGDGAKPYGHGMLGVWCAGEMHYLERRPDEPLWRELEREATQFLADVEARREPEALGTTLELPMALARYRKGGAGALDLSEPTEANRKLLEAVQMFAWARDQAGAADKTKEGCRAQIVLAAKDADEVLLPEGWRLSLKRVRSAEKLVTPDMVGKPLRKASTSLVIRVAAGSTDTTPGILRSGDENE